MLVLKAIRLYCFEKFVIVVIVVLVISFVTIFRCKFSMLAKAYINEAVKNISQSPHFRLYNNA